MMLRSTFRLSFIGVALLAPAASARATVPQQGGAGGGRATSVRTRCTTCGTEREIELRQTLERLILKTESLRLQMDSVPRNSTERERLGIELNRTVIQFKATMNELMNVTTVAQGQGPAVATTRAAPRAAAGGMGGVRAAPPGAVAMEYEPSKPRGYLGVTLEYGQPATKILRDGEEYIRFYEYPKIALVEPSSPAERAGILAGDTLLELNGTDVRKEISWFRLLVPEARITMRVRRDGDAKNMRVIVGEAPQYYTLRTTPLPARSPRAPQRVEVYTEPPPGQSAPTPMAAPRFFVFTPGVAGARLETISERIGKALGVSEGVFVLGVAPGPAQNAGLLEGDIILKAAGQTVPHVQALRQILQAADGEEGVKLVILRERKEQTLTLHWR